MSRTAFTAKLAMASRLSMVAAMVTALPASADMVLTIPDSTDSIVPASTPVAYDEMTIPVVETRLCDNDEHVISIDTLREISFVVIFR